MRKLIVSEKYNNKKLCNFILDSFPNLNKNILFKALRKKDVRINNTKVNSDCTIKTGDSISVYIVDDLLFSNSFKIDVVYEDKNILAVNKPEKLTVKDYDTSAITLTSLLKEKYGNSISPCHRIDRNTKGMVLFAKNSEALEIILNKFKSKEIEKHYYCKVFGIPPKKHEILEAYLFKDSKKSLVYISDSPKKHRRGCFYHCAGASDCPKRAVMS